MILTILNLIQKLIPFCEYKYIRVSKVHGFFVWELQQLRRATRNFQGRESFMELGHFDKLFVKNTQKKIPQDKILELLFLDTLKTTF